MEDSANKEQRKSDMCKLGFVPCQHIFMTSATEWVVRFDDEYIVIRIDWFCKKDYDYDYDYYYSVNVEIN